MHIFVTMRHRARVFIYSTTNQPTPRKRYPQRVHEKNVSIHLRYTAHSSCPVWQLSNLDHLQKKITTLYNRHITGRFFSYLTDKSRPNAPVSFYYAFQRLSSLRLPVWFPSLTVTPAGHATQRWRGVGPALVGQGGNKTPYITRQNFYTERTDADPIL
jgi:hypothetical protein